MMKDKEALAVLVGEAWAQRMLDKLSERPTVGGEWPGRPEDVAILAEPLSDDAGELQVLGQVILTNAQRAWQELTQQLATDD